jgi:hypothetical protein
MARKAASGGVVIGGASGEGVAESRGVGRGDDFPETNLGVTI